MRVRTSGVAAFLLAVSCAGLPRLDTATPHIDSTPRVLTSHGELPEVSAEALLERNDKRDEPTLLDRHLATMQKISDAPLVAGNAARLLVDGPASYKVIFEAI